MSSGGIEAKQDHVSKDVAGKPGPCFRVKLHVVRAALARGSGLKLPAGLAVVPAPVRAALARGSGLKLPAGLAVVPAPVGVVQRVERWGPVMPGPEGQAVRHGLLTPNPNRSCHSKSPPSVEVAGLAEDLCSPEHRCLWQLQRAWALPSTSQTLR